MTNDQIIEIAKQLYGADLKAAQLRNHKTVEFARLIQAAQREIDAGICDERMGTWVDCAAAIRKGG